MKYEFKDVVRFSEVDENGYLTLTALVNYFQDTAIFQSEEGGVGFDYLKPENLAWLLSSWQIEIDHMPRLRDPVTSVTWTYGFRDFYGYRNFVLYDAQGNKAAWANSIWFMCNTRLQIPVKIDERSLKAYGTEPRIDMEYLPRKIRLPEGTAGNGQAEDSFKIERHHLDTNHHVNNGQYIDMAVQYLPLNARIRQVRAEYRMQARLGDEITPVVYKEDNVWTVTLNSSGGKAYAVVQVKI